MGIPKTILAHANTSQVTSQITILQCCFKTNRFTHVIRLVSLKLLKVIIVISGTTFEELSEIKKKIIIW